VERTVDIGSVVCVSRLIPRKAHQYLISAIPYVVQSFPEAKFCFIGGGPELESLKKLARKLKIEDKVRFRGHLPKDETIKQLASADIFVLHTLHEAFGLVYLEAMALGKPIVTTTEGAGQEVVAKAGLFVPVRKPKAFAQAILKLLNDRELRNEKAEAGLSRVAFFDWGAIIQQYASIFRTLVGHEKS